MNYNDFHVNDYLNKYAEMILKIGLKIKNGDILVIRTPIEAVEFTRVLTEMAYNLGAIEVVVDYRDTEINKLKFKNESLEVLSNIAQYKVDKENYYMNKKAKYLSVIGGDPDAFKGIDPNKLLQSGIANSKALREFNDKMMANYTSWCVVGASIAPWATKVFPKLNEEEAVRKLWFEIFNSVRLFDKDPKRALENHIENLNYYAKFLNDNKFKELRYTSKKGTNLSVKLPDNYIFAGAIDFNSSGDEFIANIPSEEVFTAPHREGVDGIVYNTIPLNYNGNLIDNFYLKFKNGKVVDFDAEIGKDYLRNILETDEDAKRLGEVALVSYNTPISMRKILFYNTLYDENASCHLALGKAYPSCVKGGEDMSLEELKKIGLNDSLTHVDFMIGDETTNIVGVKNNGEEIQIFKNGNFVI